jgi:hypothetical protein
LKGLALGALIALCLSSSCSNDASPTRTTATTLRERLPRIDVDGDGRADRVRFERVYRSPGRSDPRQVWTLTVETPSAADARAVVSDYLFARRPWFGVTDLDNSPGSELVLRRSSGAHTQFFVVMTWRNGELVELPSPDGRRRWAVDGAYNVAVGVRCETVADEHRVVLTSASPNDPTDEFLVGASTTWTARGDTWVKLESHPLKFTRGSDEDNAAIGWRCPGLPAY